MREYNFLMHLKLPNTAIITDPSEMRILAIDYYSGLWLWVCQYGPGETASADRTTDSFASIISLDEMSAAVQQLICGCFSGVDGLPSEFYKCFWTLLVNNLFEVFRLFQLWNSGCSMHRHHNWILKLVLLSIVMFVLTARLVFIHVHNTALN